jgi:hypothetical protein
MDQLMLNVQRARDDASIMGFASHSVGMDPTSPAADRPPSPSKAAIAPMPLHDPSSGVPTVVGDSVIIGAAHGPIK